MLRTQFLASALLSAALMAAAQFLPPQVDYPASADYSLVSTSSTIVVGTVAESAVPALPNGRPTRTADSARVVLTVEKTLKGTAPERLEVVVPLRLDFTTRGAAPNVSYDVRGWLPDVSAGKRILVGLVLSPAGLTVPYNYTRPEADIERVAALVADFPLRITMWAPRDPFAFAANTTVPIKIENVGKLPVDLNWLRLNGFWRGARGEAAAFSATTDTMLTREEGKPPAARALKPGEEGSYTATVKLAEPASWRLFDPASLLQAPLALRMEVTVTLARPGEKDLQFTVASPWTSALGGYPLPPALD